MPADDVAYTFDTNLKIANNSGNGNKPYIASVVASDPSTVVITATLNDEGKATNPLMLVNFLGSMFSKLQKAWIQTVEARCNNDATAIKADPAEALYIPDLTKCSAVSEGYAAAAKVRAKTAARATPTVPKIDNYRFIRLNRF